MCRTDLVRVLVTPLLRRTAVTSAVLFLLAGMTACGSRPDDVSGQSAISRDAVPAEPGLQGLWAIRAAGEPDGTTINLMGGDWTLMRPCARLTGTWAARGGLFLGDAEDYPDFIFPNQLPCPDAEKQRPTWVDRVTGYRPAGANWKLVGSAGEVVAELGAGATWPAGQPRGAAFMEIGGDDVYPQHGRRAELNATDAVPLPAGVRAPTASDLFGRWEPAFDRTQAPWCDQPFLDFHDDLTWVGHNSGDDARGRWVLTKGGLALATAEWMMASGCPGISGQPDPDLSNTYVDAWMLRMARLGLDGDALVLYEPNGLELGRLFRADPPASSDDVDHDGLSDATEDSMVDRSDVPPEPEEPKDPRRAGVAVPGGAKYLAYTDEGQLQFLSGRHELGEEAFDTKGMLGVDDSGKGAVLLTGCVMGDVWVTVHSRTTPPSSLATSMQGWEVGEEATMSIAKPLYGMDVYAESWYEKVFTPTAPGLHRVRVLAKGQEAGADEDVCEGKPVEYYDITVWPVLTKEPWVRKVS